MGTKKKTPVKQVKNRAGDRKTSISNEDRPKEKKDDLFGFMKGKFEIVGDIESPIEDWKYSDPAKNLEE